MYGDEFLKKLNLVYKFNRLNFGKGERLYDQIYFS